MSASCPAHYVLSLCACALKLATACSSELWRLRLPRRKRRVSCACLSSLCIEVVRAYSPMPLTAYLYCSSTRPRREASGRGDRPLCRGLPDGLRAGRVRAARPMGTRVCTGLPRCSATATLRVCTRWIRRNGGLSGAYINPASVSTALYSGPFLQCTHTYRTAEYLAAVRVICP